MGTGLLQRLEAFHATILYQIQVRYEQSWRPARLTTRPDNGWDAVVLYLGAPRAAAVAAARTRGGTTSMGRTKRQAVSTIAVSTFSFGPEAVARDAMDFVTRHGFHGLELGSYTYWPQALVKADRRYLRLQSAAHGVDLSIHFIHRGVAPASHDQVRRDRHLKELEETLEIARDIGAKVVVVHPGPVDCPDVAPGGDIEEVRSEATVNLKDFLSAVVPKAEAEGVVLGLENLHHGPGQVIQSYGELRDLVKSLGSPAVQITLDTGHAYLSDGLTGAFETFAPFLRHIHIHDSDGQQDHLELGLGGVDFNEWMDALRPYPFSLVMETRNDADVEGSILRSRVHLKRLLGDAAR